MQSNNKNLPIGVFDSGLGGLTVVRAIRRLLPEEDILYLGDSARVPYGTRSRATIVRYARKCSGFLTAQGLKMLVVACNTASAVALEALRDEIDLPVLGVITAGAKAVAKTRATRIGVIGTTGTVESNAYVNEIHGLAPQCKVFQQAAPLFVPLAEEGWTTGEVPLLAAMRYLTPLTKARVQVLMLGCTHYPLLYTSIEQALDKLGSEAAIIDSASAMASDIADTLNHRGIRRESNPEGSLRCFVTDLPASFADVAARFLGHPIAEVEEVDI